MRKHTKIVIWISIVACAISGASVSGATGSEMLVYPGETAGQANPPKPKPKPKKPRPVDPCKVKGNYKCVASAVCQNPNKTFTVTFCAATEKSAKEQALGGAVNQCTEAGGKVNNTNVYCNRITAAIP